VNVINGAELRTENGSLRFVVGPKALAAGYDANGNMILLILTIGEYIEHMVWDIKNNSTHSAALR
jgi:hypothetical protein